MAKKIEAWEASDGSLHGSELKALAVDREIQRRAHIYEFAKTMWEAGSHTSDFVNFMTSNWGHLVQMVREYEGDDMAKTKQQLIENEQDTVPPRPCSDTAASQMVRCDSPTCEVFIFKDASICWKCNKRQEE
jgi:predicted metalloprotease with PDZ domain